MWSNRVKQITQDARDVRMRSQRGDSAMQSAGAIHVPCAQPAELQMEG